MLRFSTMTIICVVGAVIAASILAVPLDFRESPENSLLRLTGQPKALSITPLFAPPVYKSGDTVYLLCTDTIFQFASYGGTDCWGWRSSTTGLEIAVMGTLDAIKFVNPATRTVTSSIPAPNEGCSAYWRDMKSYKNVVYATSECYGTNQGLMVMSMNGTTGVATFVRSVPTDNIGNVASHNLSIDTINGYAYLEGENSLGVSIHIHDLVSNPLFPAFVNSFGPGDVHDVLATDDTVYVAEGWLRGFSIYDLTNKMSPVLLTHVAVPTGGYLHNVWPTPDRHYVATTEETANRTIKIWDIQDLANIQLAGEYLATNGLTHNVHFGGDTLYISHYESGMTVVDCGDPYNPVQIGQVDTYGNETPNYNGCWGAFPFTQSTQIYASNMDGKLFIINQSIETPIGKMWADTTAGPAGSQIQVDVRVSSNEAIHKLVIPFDWTGAYGMTFDSVSRAGTLIANWTIGQYLLYDPAGEERICVTYTSSINGSVPDLPAGSNGVVLKLFFTIPAGATGASNPVSLPLIDNSSYPNIVSNGCLSFLPDTASGKVELGSGSCCIGIRGNANGDAGQAVNVADITFLVKYLFASGPQPPCLAEANANGDSTNSVNVSDITRLVNYLFKGGIPPAPCP
jgi:choice-of-anchor B domain-containing protein